jgi:hypothetical protein
MKIQSLTELTEAQNTSYVLTTPSEPLSDSNILSQDRLKDLDQLAPLTLLCVTGIMYLYLFTQILKQLNRFIELVKGK